MAKKNATLDGLAGGTPARGSRFARDKDGAKAASEQEQEATTTAAGENEESEVEAGEDAEVVSAGEDGDLLQRTLGSAGILDAKFWQKSDYFRSLLDPELIKKLDLTTYDLAKLLNEFFSEMFKENYIDFKVSGIAVHSAAKIYRWKITEVLQQQEKEEEERKKEELRRNIPSTISQPLRPGRQIATQEDFLTSMRSAIIEVMRNREKQTRKMAKVRVQQEEEARKSRVKKKLPESIRKALLGKERIEETFQRWLDIMLEKARKAPDHRVSYMNDLKPMVTKKDRYGYRFEQARLFLSMMFLRNRDKIDLEQHEELGDIYVTKQR